MAPGEGDSPRVLLSPASRRVPLTPTLPPQAGRGSVASSPQQPINADKNFKQPLRRHCERSEAIHCLHGGTMDCFVATLLAMTRQDTPPHSRGMICPSDASTSSLESKRAQGMPDAQPHPWPACNKK